MKVRDIMTSEELATATLDTTLEEIAGMMKDENVGAIPILDEEDNLAGIITDRDIVVRAIAEGQDPSSCTAEEILSGQLHIIEPDADLEQAADLMARHKIRRLPVVEDRMIIGMISLGDISVKAEDEKAGEALGDISEGVKPSRGKMNAAGRSSGEAVAEEETEYQRKSAPGRGRQQGGTRAESVPAGRSRDRGAGHERKGQQKVTSARAEARSAGRNRSRKRAS